MDTMDRTRMCRATREIVTEETTRGSLIKGVKDSVRKRGEYRNRVTAKRRRYGPVLEAGPGRMLDDFGSREDAVELQRLNSRFLVETELVRRNRCNGKDTSEMQNRSVFI